VKQEHKQERRGEAVAYYFAMAILIIGLAGAVLVYVLAADAADTDAAQIANQRMYEHNLELMGGKFAVFLDEFDRWFESLWHGKALAYTIAALAFAASLACFWFAQLTAKPPTSGEQRPARRQHGR